MEYEAYKVRGYGFGLKKEITGVLGRYPTQEEAQKVADDYTQACLPDNLPDSYDMGMVRPVAAGEPAALDTDVFRGPGAPFMMDAGKLSTGQTVCLGKAADGKRFYVGGEHSGTSEQCLTERGYDASGGDFCRYIFTAGNAGHDLHAGGLLRD